MLEVKIVSPSAAEIKLKIEKLVYGISRNVNDTGRRAGKDESKIMDNQASLINITLNGILSTDSTSSATTKVQALITAAREWWLSGSQDTSDVTKWAKIKWRDRAYQYMMIERLEVTDFAESDDHEFEFLLEIKVDTRT